MTEHFRIEVRGATPEDAASHSFSRFPIAIGRHASNDLRLDRRFVSSFHARVDETCGRLSIVDLGSTNGVQVASPRGGKIRIPSHQPHDLGPSGGEFCVGVYSFRLLRADAALEPSLAAASLALPSLPALPAPDAVRAPRGPGVRVPAYVDAAPVLPNVRSQRAREVTALAGLEELSRALAPGQGLETPHDVAELVRRLQAALELSCRGVVRLRRAQRRSLSALRLPAPVSEAEPSWGSGEDPTELARLLLDVRRPARDTSSLLAAEFQALARHQVALLEGMLEGAGALLGELAPERIEAELSGSVPARLGAFGGKLRARWRAYRERHAQLSRRDGALSLVFGRAFREAYAAYLRGAPPGRAGSARRAGKLG